MLFLGTLICRCWVQFLLKSSLKWKFKGRIELSNIELVVKVPKKSILGRFRKKLRFAVEVIELFKVRSERALKSVLIPFLSPISIV